MDEDIKKNLEILRNSKAYKKIEQHPEMDDEPLMFLEEMVMKRDKNIKLHHPVDVDCLMTWVCTPQGHAYWHKVMNIVFDPDF